MTTTRNLPALIAPRAVAVPDLAVGTPVRIVSQEDPTVILGLVGARGVIVEHRPERIIDEPPAFPFRALEDFVVAVVRNGEIAEFSFSRDELESL